MDETGKIIKISGADATVQFQRKPACENCGMCFGSKDAMKVELTLKNKVNAEVGDTVRVQGKSSNFLLSVLIVYSVPLVAFFIGVLGGILIFESDLIGFIAGFAFLILGYVIVYIVDKKVYKAKRSAILPEISGIEKRKFDETNTETNKEIE